MNCPRLAASTRFGRIAGGALTKPVVWSRATEVVTLPRNGGEVKAVTLNRSTPQLENVDVRTRPAERDGASDTDADLMVYMSMGADDPVAARDAWAEFYGRHVNYLYAVCSRAYGDTMCGDAGVGDLVAETFRKAFQCAHLFSAEGIEDPEHLRRRSRAWLGRIAQRLFQDALRKRRRLEMVHLDPDMWQQVPERTAEAQPDDERVRRVRDVLEQLSEKEQAVIRVTFQWYRPGQSHQRLPNDVVADLAATLRTTPENLRQIRRRALAKIRERLGRMDASRPATVPRTERDQ